MRSCRPPLFWKRKFEPVVIVTCVRWYCRFCLSLRDVEELIRERGLCVDHTSIWRWTQRYGPEVYRSLGGEVKRKSSTCHIDETFVRIAVKWMYLFRAVDRYGQTVDFYLSATRDREAAKIFLKKGFGQPHNRPSHVLARDGLGAIRRPFESYRPRDTWGVAAVSEPAGMAITGSNPTTGTSNGGCAPCRGRERQSRLGR